MSTQHTPGPWEIVECLDTPHSRDIKWRGYYVATAHGLVDGMDDASANARLIAAAPELLNLAYEFEAFAEAAMNDAIEEGDALSEETWRVRRDNARAAIAKATGQEGGAA